MRRWYVINTHARSEHKAAWHLANQGFRAYLPQYMKRRRHARRIDMVKAPLFPRYLFVELDLEQDQWRAISSTLGVSHMISGGEIPLAVPDGVIDDIRAREDETGNVPIAREANFRKGDKLQIMDGALIDHVGLFEAPSDQDRVVLLLNLLGRQVRVRVPVESVTAYA
ncbi:MAG: transcriptional activator RfaH [Rhodospirillales bacterium]|nr:transcriptional activator RfaH [Rhodospirillales bacterium]